MPFFFSICKGSDRWICKSTTNLQTHPPGGALGGLEEDATISGTRSGAAALQVGPVRVLKLPNRLIAGRERKKLNGSGWGSVEDEDEDD